MQLYNNNNSLVLAFPKTLLEESREKLSIYDPYTFGKVILNFPTKVPLDCETRLLNSNSDFTFCHCSTLSGLHNCLVPHFFSMAGVILSLLPLCRLHELLGLPSM